MLRLSLFPLEDGTPVYQLTLDLPLLATLCVSLVSGYVRNCVGVLFLTIYALCISVL